MMSEEKEQFLPPNVNFKQKANEDNQIKGNLKGHHFELGMKKHPPVSASVHVNSPSSYPHYSQNQS